jgi:parallel beta-helix repeat protein
MTMNGGWVAIALLVCAAATAAGEPLRYYVSPRGKDAGPGTSGAPFATLERARDAIRQRKAAEGLPPGGAIVEVAGGTYELATPFALTAEDSGAEASPIVYRGPAAHLVGGKVVTNWEPMTDPLRMRELAPEAQGKLWQADLKALGITDYGEMKSADVWAQSDPGLELFFDDRPMTLARYPNSGYMHITDVVEHDGWSIFGIPGSRVGKFLYEDERPARWTGERDIMLHGYWFWDWADQRYRVGSLDPARREITLDKLDHAFGFRKGQWFYAYNLLCELDQPGEWYLDRETGVLYFWPPAPLQRGRALVSVTRGLVTAEGVHDVRFEGLTLECARGTAVSVRSGERVSIAGCTVRNVSGSGVSIDGGRDCGVEGCDLYRLGEGGVYLAGGDKVTLTHAGHHADNNHIHDCSRWNPLYHPGIQIVGVGQRVTHNLIDNLPHVAVGFTGQEHVIEYNELHSVCYQANDCGAVYTSGADEDWTLRGHSIRFNYLHHIAGFEGRGCIGIYLDDCFSSADISSNLMYQVATGILIGGGRDNTLSNNLFVECGKALSMDARGMGWASGIEGYCRQKLAEVPYDKPPWSERYPQLLTLLSDQPMAPKGNVVARNVAWKTPWGWIEPAAEPHIRFEDNLVDVDPGLANPARGNFALRRGSPVEKIGFEPLPLGEMGLYQGASRASWPVTSTVRPGPPAPAPPKPQPHPMPAARAPKVVGGILADGVVAPGEWPEPAMILGETPSREAVVSGTATAWACHDGETLYLAISVPVQDGTKLKLGGVWGSDDGAEVCFRDASRKKPGPTFGIRGFPVGRHVSYTDAGAPSDLVEALGAATQFAAKVTEDSWTGEWAIPLAAAGLGYRPGSKLGFNVGALRSEANEWVIRTGTLGPTWQLDNAGTLILE